MGQNRWGWVCALCAAAIGATATRLMAAESELAKSSREKIEAALNSKLNAPIDAPGIPLNQITDSLATDYDIPIVFDTAALDAMGTSPATEVTAKLRNISLRSALDLILKPLELTYVVDQEVLLITTADEAESRLEVHVYPVADLQAAGPKRAKSTGKSGEPATLAVIVASLVEQDSWAVQGTGEGEIQEWPGMLIVSNTARVHQEIESLFADMRLILAANASKEGAQAANEAAAATAYAADMGSAPAGDFYADPAHSYGGGYGASAEYDAATEREPSEYGGQDSGGAYAPIRRTPPSGEGGRGGRRGGF